jgi:hypothetical protein
MSEIMERLSASAGGRDRSSSSVLMVCVVRYTAAGDSTGQCEVSKVFAPA